MHKLSLIYKDFSCNFSEVDNKVQGWRTRHVVRITYKTYAYKWPNHDKHGTYKSNCTNKPIGWQLSTINQSENDLNTHSGISTIKKEMMVEHIITKEIIFMKSKMRSWKHYRLINPRSWTFIIKSILGFIAFLQKYRFWNFDLFSQKYSKVIVFSKLGFQTIPNYLSYYDEDLVHWLNIK